jgi:proton-dependent oligopeptide transporter, POT family
MVMVLKNVRFALFLLVSSGFFFIYSQVYNVLPLYLKKVVETDPAVDIYTMANPFVIVFFQLLITRMFGKMKPIKSIIVGIVIIGASMLINIIPIYSRRQRAHGRVGPPADRLAVHRSHRGDDRLRRIVHFSARTYEYIGALAPKGQEGLFLGYANLPMAIGALIGGPGRRGDLQ